MLSVVHFFLACLAGSFISWKLLKETSLLLLIGSGPLFGSVLIVGAANWGLTPLWSMLAILALLIALFFVKAERPSLEPLKRWQRWTLGALCCVVFVFTYQHSIHVLDSDRWLHDMHIVAFSRGIYPPVNPLFPDLAMNGHFGRDLFMSVLHRAGSDPVVVTWWVTPFIQLATFLTLFASSQSLTKSATRGLLMASMVFFGMDCGFRVGLIDTFDGSNALAHPWLILLMYLMVRLLERPTWQACLVSGVVLGTYQLVYMTSFALLLATGFCLYVLKARDGKAWLALVVTGVLAMGLAVTEGGAFTDLAHRGTKPQLSKAVQNQGLRVSLQFPKEKLFQVPASTAEYQSLSVAYKTSLFKGLQPKIEGGGYQYLWSPSFLAAHWLPLYLAPFTLLLCRRSALALAYWLFGAISFIIPGLVYFGPIFEYEYYRWEFTAALGFAAALGYALGDFLEGCPIAWKKAEPPRLEFGPGSGRFLLAILVLFASLLAGEKLLNDEVIRTQKSDLPWFPSSQEYRLSDPTFRITDDDLQATAWLRSQTEPGARILTNRLDGRPGGLWPDAITAALSGAFPVGHAFPPRSQVTPHGNPAFLPNTVATAFWATGNWDLLEPQKVSWIVADSDKLSPEVVKAIEAVDHKRFGKRLVAKVPESQDDLGQHSPEVTILEAPFKELRLGHSYPLEVRVANPASSTRVTLSMDQPEVEPLSFLVEPGNHDLEWTLVTPHDEGTYRATLRDSADRELASFDFSVDFLARLAQVEIHFELPQLKARSLYNLSAELSGPMISSQGELDLYYRFKRDNGDYAWEVDSIYRPVQLALPAEPVLDIPLMTPELPGVYQLEFWFFDRFSGRHIKTAGERVVHVES